MDDHHLGSIKKLLKKTFQIQINVFLGIFLLSDDKRKSHANLQIIFLHVFGKSRHFLRKKSQKSPHLDTQDMEVSRTKGNSEKILLAYLTSSHI
jgi:hypothetical protein